MKIEKKLDGTALTLTVEGSLDTTTSPDFQAEIESSLAGVTALAIDFAGLDYVSSAGLRVLLMANKKMIAAGGEMKILNVNPSVREVFEMTGFSDIFTLA